MNLNDFRINAYKKAAGLSKEEQFQNQSDEKEGVTQNYNSSFVSSLPKFSRDNDNKIIKKAEQSSAFIKSSKKIVDDDYDKEQLKEAAKVFTQGTLIKVPDLPLEQDGRESLYTRVAKFLLLIGLDEAAKILPHLKEEQIEKIIPEIASIRSIDSEEAQNIMTEFSSLLDKARQEEGGVDAAREILIKAFGSEKASQVLEKAVPWSSGKPFDYLFEADSDKILLLLKDESSAVRALVLSFLNPKVSASVINNLPAVEKTDVILRLAKLKQINPDVVKSVDKSMRAKMEKLATQSSNRINGKDTLAQILKRMDIDSEEKLLSYLSYSEPELSDELRQLLFTQEDIINSDDRFIEDLLRQWSDDEIARLIAGKDQLFRDKILHNISAHRAGLVLDTESYSLPYRRSDVDDTTNKFFAILRRAYEDGKLIIKGRDDEIYV